MSTLDVQNPKQAVWSDVVSGADEPIVITISDVPEGYEIAKAWLTVKTNPHDLDTSVFQCIVPGSGGQLIDNGAGDQIGVVRFTPTRLQTALLTQYALYYFDVQVMLGDGEIKKPIVGQLRVVQGVTSAIA